MSSTVFTVEEAAAVADADAELPRLEASPASTKVELTSNKKSSAKSKVDDFFQRVQFGNMS